MRTIFCFCLLLLFVVLGPGCGGTSEKPSTQQGTKPEQLAANEATASESQSTDPSLKTYTGQASQSNDVREPGPPNNGSEPETSDEQAFASPLKDIPPPAKEEPAEPYVEKQTIEIPKNWTRVTREGQSEIWIDIQAKQVIVAGRTCLQQGGLEMFICPFFTKEHESVIAVNAKSFEVHTSLLAIGATPGSPVQWEPEYKPATGPVVKIDVMWKDNASGKIITRRGQEMVRDFKTKEPMDLDWIFGGSVLETDPETGQSYYYGDGGELVCLSNFATATMDIPIQSSDSNEDLLFEANPDAIPDLGTKVYVIFKPEIKPAATDEAPRSAERQSDN